MQYVNTSSHKFIELKKYDLREMRDSMKARAIELDLKGTILLSTEGINSFLSGTPENVDTYIEFLRQWPEFSDMHHKLSYSTHQPFTRMLVRLKKEIIPMGITEVDPEKHTAPHLSPEELKRWYDEGKDMIILDTRNDYEVEIGTFENAVDLNIDKFREFSDAVEMLPKEAREKPVVTFCTGGIRCEKAAELMLQKGFKEVYQLDGGILNYFEKCGGDHYEGECFVFDKRVALNPELEETNTKQCYACQGVLTIDLQTDDGICPHCHQPHRNNLVAKQAHAASQM